MNAEQRAELQDFIAGHLDQIAMAFKGDCKFTCIVTGPRSKDADVIVTNESIENLQAALTRFHDRGVR